MLLPWGMSDRRNARCVARVLNVLIVDDVADNRDMYAEYFEFRGFHVSTAENGQDGLTRALADPPDVIIVDLTMPVLDGWRLTRQIRSHAETQKTRIIVLTGRTLDDSESTAIQAGAHAFLTKPCLPHVLEEEVRRLLQ